MIKRILLALAVLLPSAAWAQLPTTTGWYQIPNTSAINLCNAATPTQSGSCAAVITAWNSGIADTLRNRLCWTGGGHTDYSGNQIYCVSLTNLTVSQITNPDPNPGSGCLDADPSGNPNQVHTYGGLSYYASTDQMSRHGGALWCPAGTGTNAQWLFSMSTSAWTRSDPMNGTTQTTDCCNYQTASDYDPVSDLIYYIDDEYLWSYNAHTNTQTQVSTLPFELFPNQDDNCVIAYQPDRYMVCMGEGIVATADLTASPPTFTVTTTTGCSTGMASPNYPALAFDPVQDLIVSWNGGNNVYTYNTTTQTCATVSYASGPGVAVSGNGVFGRFRYFPALGGFALVNDMSQNAYFLRMTPYNANFNNYMQRATAPGVIVAETFNEATLPIANNTGGASSGLQPANNGTTYPTQDCTHSTNGTCSLHFTLPTSGTSNPDGYWGQNFASRKATKPTGAGASIFGTGSTFYIQYQQMMDANYISNTWSGSFWKMSDIFSTVSGSCSGMEITFVNSFNDGFPQGYTDCGNEAFQVAFGNGDYLLEQGDVVGGETIGSGTGYNCHYVGHSYGPPNQCALYQPLVWQTYYYKITVGSVTGGANSTVNAWAVTGGAAYPTHQFINLNNVSFTGASGSDGFNTMFLESYFTGGYASGPNAANTWYDELIISTQPIAAPNATSTPAAAPSCTPAAGTYTGAQSAVCTDSSSGAVMCYTTNGATPATNGGAGCNSGTLYSVAVPISQTTNFQVIAGGTGYTDSTVAAYSYLINTPVGAVILAGSLGLISGPIGKVN